MDERGLAGSEYGFFAIGMKRGRKEKKGVLCCVPLMLDTGERNGHSFSTHRSCGDSHHTARSRSPILEISKNELLTNDIYFPCN